MCLLFRTGRSVPLLTFALWPTSPFLMATEGNEHTLFSYLIVGATIAGNALVMSRSLLFSGASLGSSERALDLSAMARRSNRSL
jgi:hypothetical protein